MIIQRLNESNFAKFNSIESNVNEWLEEFEIRKKRLNILDLSMLIISEFLDETALNFFH